jgi:hypothetical protein
MVVNGWVIGSVVLVAIIIGAALLRQRTLPLPADTADLQHIVAGLKREIAELREKTDRQEATIKTLQELLYQKQAEIDRLTTRIWQLEHPPAPAPAGKPNERPEELLVVLGDDPALAMDAAVLRSNEITARWRLAVMRKATKKRLADTLQRYRTRGTPIRRIHFAVHGSEAGIKLGEETADGIWLSEHLAGTEVALITGCSTATAAHLARVVPTVISMTWEVAMEDAMEFAACYWSLVASGMSPSDAFYGSVRRAPAAGELAELHE